jgi:hypothetical protein
MSIFEDTNPRDLKELLGQIHSRETVLPDFQRDFVWDPGETKELIVSIAQNYPAGSLLRIRNTKNLFACRAFAGAPPLDGHHGTYLVLDGQQRLTSLYQAFYGVGEHRYFLNVKKLLDGGDIEESVFFVRANHATAKAFEKFENQARDLVMPLAVLKNGATGFSHWSMQVAQHAATGAPEGMQAAFGTLGRLTEEVGKRWVQTMDDYRFPVVTLADSTSAASVCTIFETLNRTGVKLGPFELLTARFWPLGVNLRALWQEARDAYPIIDDFDVDPYYLLQSISLVARRTPACKRSDVLDLSADHIRTWWGPTVRGLARGLAMLRDDCGVIVPKWLPAAPTLVTLAAVLARLGEQPGPAAGATRQKLVRWYWCAVFGQVYDQAPNTRAVRDFTEILEWIAGGALPDTIAGFRFDPAVLTQTTPNQRTLYRGLICLILRNGPRDFHSGKPITGDLMIEHRIDDHHVFPQDWLDKAGAVPATLRNCIVNRTLIDRATNQRISNRPPSDYMQEIRAAQAHAGHVQQLLASHLLPTAEDSPLMRDDYAAFLEWRREALWREVLAATSGDGSIGNQPNQLASLGA